MSDLVLTFLMPAVLVGFYIGLNWSYFQPSRGQQLVIGLGLLSYYGGVVCYNFNPAIGSLLKLAGTLAFLVLIVYQAIKRRK